MKKALLFLFLGFMVTGSLAKQSDDSSKTSDDIVKTGWNLGLLPAVAFNSDLGFEYGVIANLYYYGDGSHYPNYDHSLYFEVSRFTKGSGIYRFYYDSEYLIPGIRLTADLSYLPDEAYDFYGFNGYESVYQSKWQNEDANAYRTRMFYNYQRNLFRIKADFQGQLSGKSVRWIAGVCGRNFDISSVDIEKLNEGKDKDEKLPPLSEEPGLYERYIDWGLIPQDEKNGGLISTVKAGVVYDTRDKLQNPSTGIWTEAVVVASHSAIGSDENFAKFSLTHRQYLPLLKEKLTFAYRLGYQGTVAGHAPFYYQPIIETSVLTGAWNEGLGGQRSIRGVNRNRIVGDGFVYGNFELRWIPFTFTIANQNFYVGFNGFFDTGRIVQEIQIEDELENIGTPQENYFNPGAESFHSSAGIGLKLAMNWNFVLSVEYGHAMDPQDGNSGLYIALNYLF